MVGVFGGDHVGQQVMEHAVVAGLESLVGRVRRLVPAPFGPTLFHLVVAAPQRQAGAVPQPADVLDSFDAHVFGKGVVFGIDAAGKDEILPDEQAIAVA